MELRHLRYFIAVAEELSFSRAANRLQMAQPPLSQQIKALETELDVLLFDRTKPIQLTPAGQALLESATAILIQLDQTVHKLHRIQQGESGHLTIGFTSSIANGILPNILRSFRHHYPDVNLILREDNSAFQVQGLRDRQTDIIFVYHSPGVAELHDLGSLPLLQEPLIVALPENHPLSAQTRLTIADLANEAFVIPHRFIGSDLAEQTYTLCAQAGFVPKIAQEATFMVTILGLVAGEIGISILPSSVQNLQRQGVIYRPLQEQTPVQQLQVLWRPQDFSPLVQRFLEIAESVSTDVFF